LEVVAQTREEVLGEAFAYTPLHKHTD